MSESHTEPHVTGRELRAALTRQEAAKPNPLTAPAWEWTSDEEVQVEELRAELARLEGEMDRVRVAVSDARAREHEARQALARLARARPWERRGVVAELAVRGLL